MLYYYKARQNHGANCEGPWYPVIITNAGTLAIGSRDRRPDLIDTEKHDLDKWAKSGSFQVEIVA